MPTLDTLERFIALVEAGAGLAPIEQFYTDDAVMQENEQPPRVGKTALLEHEARALLRVARVRAKAVRPVLRDGDTVVIRWTFEITSHDGRSTRVEELAWQRWQGEHIAHVQFFLRPGPVHALTTPQHPATAGRVGETPTARRARSPHAARAAVPRV